jgi:hypothetical protein
MVLDSLEIGLEDAETEPPPKVAISRRRFREGRRSGQLAGWPSTVCIGEGIHWPCELM